WPAGSLLVRFFNVVDLVNRLEQEKANGQSGKIIRQLLQVDQACLRPRERFWDIPVPKIDSAFDNLLVPQPSWSPSTTQQLRKLVAAPYLAPNDWTPRSEAYFVFPLAQGTPGKQCGLAATGVYQPSLRSPWLAALVILDELGYLPYPASGGTLLFHLVSQLYERTSLIITTNLS
ncbi:ATP-binding protein, partial [Thiolapillus sp.]|uniref:ATP-binding protein n=1 Tax=Thiolapillus sp. TaxID=2017437 RepID=UPI003AF78F16